MTKKKDELTMGADRTADNKKNEGEGSKPSITPVPRNPMLTSDL